ncbi:MAG: hypothetical protein IT576_07835 [Verrucomicrobiales bacterium]|nr:hypothetical protein [Verrucomicrobiales bacterium]
MNRRKSKLKARFLYLREFVVRHWGALLLLAGHGLVLLGCLGASAWVTPPSGAGTQAAAWEPPGPAFPWGTDDAGQDVRQLVLGGVGPPVVFAYSVATLGMVLALLVGLGTKYYLGESGCRALRAIRYAVTGLPVLLVSLLVSAVAGGGFWVTVVAVGVPVVLNSAGWASGWLHTLEAEGHTFAARAAGLSRARVLLAHVLPLLLPKCALRWAVLVPSLLLVEASLGFAGYGTFDAARPDVVPWGRLLAEGRAVLFEAPWLVGHAGAALTGTLLFLALLAWALHRVIKEDLTVPPL